MIAIKTLQTNTTHREEFQYDRQTFQFFFSARSNKLAVWPLMGHTKRELSLKGSKPNK
jgi:hypothetical protein